MRTLPLPVLAPSRDKRRDGGAPRLPALPESKVIPPSLQGISALDRHLWFFNVATQLGRAPLTQVKPEEGDHSVGFADLQTGLKALGLSTFKASVLATGVLVDRGGRQALKGEGLGFRMNIDPRRVESTGHSNVSRSSVYDANGNVDEAKLDVFLNLLDAKGTGKITQASFKTAASRLMAQRIDGDGPVADLKRWLAGGTFERAWGSFMSLAAHQDSNGQRYVTRDDVRWFFDGSYFFRLAQALNPT
jgi:hypothetical protein